MLCFKFSVSGEVERNCNIYCTYEKLMGRHNNTFCLSIPGGKYPYLWDALHGRDQILCPSYSKEDRIWLKRKFTWINTISSDFVSYYVSKLLLEFGIYFICKLLRPVDINDNKPGYNCGNTIDSNNTEMLISCHTSATKMILALSLAVEGKQSDHIPWLKL